MRVLRFWNIMETLFPARGRTSCVGWLVVWWGWKGG